MTDPRIEAKALLEKNRQRLAQINEHKEIPTPDDFDYLRINNTKAIALLTDCPTCGGSGSVWWDKTDEEIIDIVDACQMPAIAVTTIPCPKCTDHIVTHNKKVESEQLVKRCRDFVKGRQKLRDRVEMDDMVEQLCTRIEELEKELKDETDMANLGKEQCDEYAKQIADLKAEIEGLKKDLEAYKQVCGTYIPTDKWDEANSKVVELAVGDKEIIGRKLLGEENRL